MLGKCLSTEPYTSLSCPFSDWFKSVSWSLTLASECHFCGVRQIFSGPLQYFITNNLWNSAAVWFLSWAVLSRKWCFLWGGNRNSELKTVNGAPLEMSYMCSTRKRCFSWSWVKTSFSQDEETWHSDAFWGEDSKRVFIDLCGIWKPESLFLTEKMIWTESSLFTRKAYVWCTLTFENWTNN